VIGLIAINIIVFIQELLSPNINAFFYRWALVPNQLNFSDIYSLYPFITSMFLHGGFAHILFNMWYLWIFGDNVEGDLGTIPFLLFYLAGGIVASLSQLYFMQDSNIPLLGASGAIAAVLGYYLIRFPDHDVDSIVILGFFITRISIPALFVLGFWFITQVFSRIGSLANSTGADGGTAWFAHIGGFVFGLLAGVVMRMVKGSTNRYD
jgi:membrane associated rhomboid family serine protease